MRRIITSLALITMLGCANDKEYLNGPIKEYETFAMEKEVECTVVPIEDKHLCSGIMGVCDSLLVFSDSAFPGKLVHVLNLNTGKEIAALCPKGRSGNTYDEARYYNQFEKSDGAIKLWVHNSLKSIDLVNLTESIATGQTVYDKTVKVPELDLCYTRFGLGALYNIGEDKFMGNVLCHYKHKYDRKYTPNYMAVYDSSFKGEKAQYKLYKKGISDAYYKFEDDPFTYYDSTYTISPDKKHIAWGMAFIAMVNTLNLETGKVKGAHQIQGYTFEDQKGMMQEPRTYCRSMCCSNDYVYVLYTGHILQSEENYTEYSDRITVFDWEGNPVCLMKLPVSVNRITMDAASSTIYAFSEIDETIYKIDARI